MASTIDIRHAHNLGSELARQSVEALATDLKEALSVRYRWEGSSLTFTRKGANGRIRIGDKEVRVEVKLGLLLRPMKRKLEAKITTYLAKNLGSSHPRHIPTCDVPLSL